MKKILIIEDDIKIRNELAILLEKYGYTCFKAEDFENILRFVNEVKPHLILLDINLPSYDGFYICREIRKSSNVPIIIVTSRDSDIDELMSINLGADDFITKPYNTQILLARISSLLNRAYNMTSSDTIEYMGVCLNISKCTVTYNNRELSLTKNESRILNILMKNKQCVVSRDKLMQELWQSEEFIDDNTLTVNINRLRKKLESIGVTNFLETKRGLGYIIG